MVEITSGLEAGEQVVIDFASRFGDGAPGGGGQFQPPTQAGG
jgi:hypothetical protein